MSRSLVLFDRFLGWMNKALEFRDPGLVTELDPSFIQPTIDAIQGGIPIGTFQQMTLIIPSGNIIADPNIYPSPGFSLDPDAAAYVLGYSVRNTDAVNPQSTNLRRTVAPVAAPIANFSVLLEGTTVVAATGERSFTNVANMFPLYIPPGGCLFDSIATGLIEYRVSFLTLPAGVHPFGLR